MQRMVEILNCAGTIMMFVLPIVMNFFDVIVRSRLVCRVCTG